MRKLTSLGRDIWGDLGIPEETWGTFRVQGSWCFFVFSWKIENFVDGRGWGWGGVVGGVGMEYLVVPYSSKIWTLALPLQASTTCVLVFGSWLDRFSVVDLSIT